MSAEGSARVLWILGSDSDLPHVESGFEVLRKLEIPFEIRILSAHRTPDAVDEVARGARERGVGVLVAVAGGAAHLPGVVAARTTLPVIGVPVPSSLSGGLDSLLSIAQMPGGIPVATMGANKGGGKNAGLFAAAILGVSDPRIAASLDAYRKDMAEGVLAKDAKVRAEHDS